MKLKFLIDSSADECAVGAGVARMDAREAAAVAEVFRTSRGFRDLLLPFFHIICYQSVAKVSSSLLFRLLLS